MNSIASWVAVSIVAGLLALPTAADAKAQRSHSAAAEFQRHHPCPSTGKTHGRCPGFIKDHITPLCAGGVDRPSNMQWQTIEEAKIKDRLERHQCRHSGR